jgi:uncharacterized protein (TIGR02452 family)
MQKINYRQLNITVFQDTAEHCRTNARLRESIAQSRQAQKFTGECESVTVENRNIYAEQAKVIVSQKRTFEAAQAYAGTRVAALNFASASCPGGGVTTGAGAQEESLCRCSTLYDCLNDQKMWELFYEPHRRQRNSLHTDDCIYTPGVTVFKTDVSAPELLSETDWYNVDIITCAAPNLGYSDVTISDEALKQLHIKRLRRILDIAICNKVENIVLGAFGCGAFHLQPELVSTLFKETLEETEFKGKFHTIAFALLEGSAGPRRKVEEEGNLASFYEQFGRLR